MSGVSNGQLANENTFDSAYIARNGDSNTVGKLDLQNPNVESGSDVVNLQKEVNNLFTFLGALKNQAIGYIATFSNSNGFTANESVFARTDAISAKFHQSTGHKHTGAAGDAPKIESADLNNVVLRGYPVQGQDVLTPGTNSTDVSALMTGKTASTGSSVKGVVVTAPYNKVPLFIRTGVEANNFLTDGAGNIVYGRLTESAGVWTLTTFVDLSGTETAYALTAGQIADGLKWFYQELFNPIVDAPIYDSLFFVQSDNTTADVVDATATQRGLVSAIAQFIGGLKTFVDGIATDTISEETAAAGVTVDGVLLKDGLVDGRDVSTDGTNLDNHIANTSNPHATTKAQVGLGNVTDDAQLKRAAADFDSFTEKTNLVNDDLFLIEDSEAGLVKKKVKRSNVGSGGGAGARNFITNGNGESSTTSPFTPYADAAASRPVDGTGGSPTVTTSTTTSTPIEQTRSILLTKPSGNCQGQGWSADFSVDAAQKAKALRIKVKNIVNSGTFVAGQNFGTPVDSDVIWYVYDVTNGRLIEPSSIRMLSNSSTLVDEFLATFQTSADSTSYRLIAHVATTTASAFELKVEVEVSESQSVFGTPFSDEAPFTNPSSQGLGTLSGVELFQTRAGDKLKVRGRITLGTTTAVEARLGLPAGLSIKSGINNSNVGTFGRGTGSQANKGGFILAGGGNTHVNFSTADVIGSTSADPTANAVGTAIGNSGNVLFIEFEVPIQGWSASVQMSDSADNRLLSLKATKNGVQSVPNATETFITSWTTNKDAGFSFVASTGEATILSAGDFFVFGHLAFAANTSGLRYSRIYVDGVAADYGSTGGAPASGGDTMTTFVTLLPNLRAGQKVRIAGFQSSGGALNIDPAATYFQMFKLSGGQNIAANEKVRFAVTSTSGQAISAGVSTTAICNVKRYDTHNIYDTSNGTFKLPRAGVAHLKARFLTANLAAGTTTYYSQILVLKNGSPYKVLSGRYHPGAGTTTYAYGEGSCDIEGTSSDVWAVQVYHPLATNIVNDTTQNFIDLTMD